MTHLIECTNCGEKIDEQNPEQRSSVDCVCSNCAKNYFFYCPECDTVLHTDEINREIPRRAESQAGRLHPDLFWGFCKNHAETTPDLVVHAWHPTNLTRVEYRYFRGGVRMGSKFTEPFILAETKTWLAKRITEQTYILGMGFWREAVARDAQERGLVTINIEDLKDGEKIYAVVTPDGVPTKVEVISHAFPWVCVKSVKTGIIYDTLADRLSRSSEGAKQLRLGPVSVKEMLTIAKEGWLIVEVNDLGNPICVLRWSTREAGAEAAADEQRTKRRPHHIKIIPITKEA